MLGYKSNGTNQTARRVILLLTLSIYLLFSIGIIKATHFCMGREASVVFFSSDTKKCACSLFAGEKDSCCDDEHDLLRIENEQKVIQAFVLPSPDLFLLEELYTDLLTDTAIAGILYKGEWTEKELPPKIPRWKTHCSLVFYDDEQTT